MDGTGRAFLGRFWAAVFSPMSLSFWSFIIITGKCAGHNGAQLSIFTLIPFFFFTFYTFEITVRSAVLSLFSFTSLGKQNIVPKRERLHLLERSCNSFSDTHSRIKRLLSCGFHIKSFVPPIYLSRVRTYSKALAPYIINIHGVAWHPHPSPVRTDRRRLARELLACRSDHQNFLHTAKPHLLPQVHRKHARCHACKTKERLPPSHACPSRHRQRRSGSCAYAVCPQTRPAYPNLE
jgi:hypothetical protein